MPPTRIAFTSCARIEDFPSQPQWKEIQDAEPHYLLLLGDQIYMDYGFSSEPNGSPADYPLDKFRDTMAAKYARQWSETHFKDLLEYMRAEESPDKPRIFGTWDDHDFGWNNAFGLQPKMTPDKYQATLDLFHQWMNCSTNRPHVYCHADIGDLARLIILDQRSHAEPASPTKPTASLLGADQWAFLRDKLNHDKQYTLLCGGLSLTRGKDNWEEYQDEYQQLRDLIEDREGVIYLGGDIHSNKFMKPGDDRPCYEIISSGLAVNLLALTSLGIDDRHNWSYLDLSEEGVKVVQSTSGKLKRHAIRFDNWWG
ncbi:MAG: alkaline phosphatase D family protein [Burkholderiales bacterium]|nr:alkaline phosphatase D family protein [Burkholderiales bacterium]